MKRIQLKRAVLTATMGLLLSAPSHSGAPLWEYSAPSPTQVTVSSNSMATVHYTVTNHSHKSKNLQLKATPGLRASPCYLPTKGSSCTLTLTVNGNAVPSGGIHGGPMLCEQGTSNQCYQPSSVNGLNIVKTQTTISATPSSFGFISGGNAQIVALTNKGPVDAYNIQVSAPGLGVSVLSDCPASLPPNNTCQLTFISGSATGTTSVTIAGGNTNTLTESITVNAELIPIAVTGGGTMTLYTNDVHAVGWMVIKNNSSVITATNISADFSPTTLNGRIIQDKSNCTSVAPGTACTLRFTVSGAGTVSATDFWVSGSNTTRAMGNLTIDTILAAPPVGTLSQGGKAACSTGGNMTSTTLYLVAAVSDNSTSIQWGGNSTATNAVSDTDGYGNTQNIVDTFGAGTGYAAGLCSDYKVDASGAPCQAGVCYEGWYLPAKNELNCLYTNQGDIGGFSSNFYWSSTESDSVNAWSQSFSGGLPFPDVKTTLLPARCVRAITN